MLLIQIMKSMQYIGCSLTWEGFIEQYLSGFRRASLTGWRRPYQADSSRNVESICLEIKTLEGLGLDLIIHHHNSQTLLPYKEIEWRDGRFMWELQHSGWQTDNRQGGWQQGGNQMPRDIFKEHVLSSQLYGEISWYSVVLFFVKLQNNNFTALKRVKVAVAYLWFFDHGAWALNWFKSLEQLL